MLPRNLKYSLLIIGVLLVLGTAALPAAAQTPPQLIVNGQILQPDVPPLIHDGRTMVPLRFVSEALGFTVAWNEQQRQVTIEGSSTSMELTIDNMVARVDGAVVFLDVPPLIVDGRTLVPLRFISERMGLCVSWNGSSRTVTVSSASSPSQNPTAPAPKNSVPDCVLQEGQLALSRLALQQSTDDVAQSWGAPLRRDSGFDGIEWWNYKTGVGTYTRLGFRNDRLIAAYALGKHWKYGGVDAGTSPGKAVEQLGLWQNTSLVVGGHKYKFECTQSDNTLPLHVDGSRVALFYVDRTKNRITATLVMEAAAFMQSNPLSRSGCSVRYLESAPPPGTPRLNATQQRAAESGEARVLMDLANTERELRGLKPLVWNSSVAQVARAHSREMSKLGYFGHDSPTAGTPEDRLVAAGFRSCSAAENIARGYADAVATHHGWMNSHGHRINLLDPDLQIHGAGIYGEYYTQDFLRCR